MKSYKQPGQNFSKFNPNRSPARQDRPQFNNNTMNRASNYDDDDSDDYNQYLQFKKFQQQQQQQQQQYQPKQTFQRNDQQPFQRNDQQGFQRNGFNDNNRESTFCAHKSLTKRLVLAALVTEYGGDELEKIPFDEVTCKFHCKICGRFVHLNPTAFGVCYRTNKLFIDFKVSKREDNRDKILDFSTKDDGKRIDRDTIEECAKMLYNYYEKTDKDSNEDTEEKKKTVPTKAKAPVKASEKEKESEKKPANKEKEEAMKEKEAAMKERKSANK